MKIEDKIDRYLNEKVSREESMDKLMKVIKSAKTDTQLKTAEKMAKNYYKMYGEKWFGPGKDEAEFFNKGVFGKLFKAVQNQSDVIKHLKMVQKELNK